MVQDGNKVEVCEESEPEPEPEPEPEKPQEKPKDPAQIQAEKKTALMTKQMQEKFRVGHQHIYAYSLLQLPTAQPSSFGSFGISTAHQFCWD